MKRNHRFFLIVLSLGTYTVAAPAVADTFGGGANSFEIEFVTIGNPGNPADSTGNPKPAGAVPYEYRIGKYEISEQLIEKANAQSAADGAPLGITKDARGPDKPATNVSWFEAARFVNWLNTSTGHMPAYKFVTIPTPRGGSLSEFALWQPGDAGYDPANLFRNRLAKYFLPSADEWYKAAFFDPTSGAYFDYPSGSNTPPVAVASGTMAGTAVYHQNLSAGPADIMQAGGLSPYGTMAQGGNVHEWEETELDLINDNIFAYRGQRGAGWGALWPGLSSTNRFGGFPMSGLDGIGFRVVSVVPEPSAAVLICLAFLGTSGVRKRRSIGALRHRIYFKGATRCAVYRAVGIC